MARFVHHDLRLLNPTLSSPLLDVLTDLEHLRRLQMRGSTPWPVFLQLKKVFHLLESLASARIEGNHTTLADYIETKMGDAPPATDTLREIANIEAAMSHIEEAVAPGDPISEALIRSLHAMAVEGLEREGDRTPGAYRGGPVTIAKAEHLPPGHLQVPGYMQDLVAFVNRADAPKYDLMKVALRGPHLSGSPPHYLEHGSIGAESWYWPTTAPHRTQDMTRGPSARRRPGVVLEM